MEVKGQIKIEILHFWMLFSGSQWSQAKGALLPFFFLFFFRSQVGKYSVRIMLSTRMNFN